MKRTSKITIFPSAIRTVVVELLLSLGLADPTSVAKIFQCDSCTANSGAFHQQGSIKIYCPINKKINFMKTINPAYSSFCGEKIYFVETTIFILF